MRLVDADEYGCAPSEARIRRSVFSLDKDYMEVGDPLPLPLDYFMP